MASSHLSRPVSMCTAVREMPGNRGEPRANAGEERKERHADKSAGEDDACASATWKERAVWRWSCCSSANNDASKERNEAAK